MAIRAKLRKAALAAGLALAIAAITSRVGTAVEARKPPTDPAENLAKDVTQGTLRIVKDDGEIVECPLKHTGAAADISGFIARVTVTQTFYNPLAEKIEAVYVFPLPHKAAVDDMTMVTGRRRIVGIIKRRAEARAIYEAALIRGATAALLEQERPNIFTQSVGNIKPGEEVKIEISYVDVLEYDMGVYEFHFPMVVGPRYIPGSPTSKIPPVPPELQGKVGELDKAKIGEGPDEPRGTGWAPDADRVPDASRITPPVLKPGYRNGHDISLSVSLEAGVPIQDIESPNHDVEMSREGPSRASVSILAADSIPNKDFVLRYRVVGEKPEMAVLAHTDAAGQGYFMLMIQPQEDERLRQMPPRELSFLIDVSGSMSGRPTAKVIEAMRQFLKIAKPDDTVQVVTFAGHSQKLFESAVPCTPENISRALNFTEGLSGSGGTEMLKGVKMAINEPLDSERVRVIIMLTDGYIGNEAEIIAEVGRRCGDRIRFWCVGIGQSPNRFLVDGVERQGGGMGKVLGLNEDAAPLVQEVMLRIHRAQLADIRIEWGGLGVFETYPARIPELWAGRPVILFGLYRRGGGEAFISVSGNVEGEPASWPLRVQLPAREYGHDVLAKVWARNKIEDLMQQTFYAGSPEVEDAVTEIALEYRLMSQYTSFVAVDESELGQIREAARPPRRMLVPVPLPEGTRFEGFFGPGGDADAMGIEVPALSLADDHITGAPGAWYTAPLRLGSGSENRAVPPEVLLYASGGSRVVGWPNRMSFACRAVAPSLHAASTSYTYYAGLRPFLPGERGLAEAARRGLQAAERLREAGELLEARARYGWVYLIDTSLVGADLSSAQAANKVLEAIEEINKKLVEAWTETLPGLGKELSLVIRDVSVADALSVIAEAAGIKINVVPGSFEDAAHATQRKEIQVTYLDLRNATAAQALDWLLVPARMTWWVAGGGVMAGTARRSVVASPWVYDVSRVALLSSDELRRLKDEDRVTVVQNDAQLFTKMVREHLMIGVRHDILWYSPGWLLIFGSPDVHSNAARLFADLADPKARFQGELAKLHRVTVGRAAADKKAAEDQLEALGKARIVQALTGHSWKLLAEAAAGRLDLEALTELQVAWKQPETPSLLGSKDALAAFRSRWAIAEAARALPKERELALLAEFAGRTCAEAEAAALMALAKAADNAESYLSVLYAALARKGDEKYMAQARPLLIGLPQESPLATAGTIATALLVPPDEVEAEGLVETISRGVTGDDVVVLTALACRRAGGEAWNTFRAEAGQMLGGQPLSGGVVVFVNRLAGPASQLAALR